MSNITQVVGQRVNMTTMDRGFLASGMKEVLDNAGPYTVFVPSDMAFRDLKAGTMEELLRPENKTNLTGLLKDHIVAGRLRIKDLKNGDRLKTLSGKELLVTQNWGKTSIDGALIQNRDLETSNGIIHSIDKVLHE